VDVVPDTQFRNQSQHHFFVGRTLHESVYLLPVFHMHHFNRLVDGNTHRLQKVNHAANIGLIHLSNHVDFILTQINGFFCSNRLDELVYFGIRQLIESHTYEFRLQRLVDFAYVIAYEAKPHVEFARLQQGLESLLRRLGHVIHLVQDDEFRADFKDMFRFYELVDLCPDDVDTALVRCIQMDDGLLVSARPPVLVLVDEIDDGGGFARSWRTVKQQIRKMIFLDDIPEEGAVQRVQHDIVEMIRSVLLYPRH
jgi:hypothetical protein